MSAPVRDQMWRQKAACLGVDPNMFFPAPTGASDDDGRGGQVTYPAEVRRLCASCPVEQACLTWALDTRQEYGYIGGTTPKQRRSLVRCHEGWCDHPKPCQHGNGGAP